MSFSINNLHFKSDLSLTNNINVKSFNKPYNLFYTKDDIDTLIRKNYLENDFILIDRNVYNLDKHCLDSIPQSMYYIFDALESNKTIDTVLTLADILYSLKFTKKNKLIVIGGGITQDVGGFVCALYKRGISWVFIPTTFLAMVDSSIGAKVSINRKSKNMLGVYCAPSNIYVSDIFLKSLKNEDVYSGLGESLKLCLIGGNETYNMFLENYETKNYINIIKVATLIKRTIIEHDEFENGERKVLNYGHEFGHALEETSNYSIPHGIAVLFGMYMVNEIFHPNKYESVNRLILNLVPEKFKKLKLQYDLFKCHLLQDKKNLGNNLGIIVLHSIGSSSVVYIPLESINDSLEDIFVRLFN